MPTPDIEPGPPRRNRLLAAAIITVIAIAFIVIHLTGVIGPGSH